MSVGSAVRYLSPRTKVREYVERSQVTELLTNVRSERHRTAAPEDSRRTTLALFRFVVHLGEMTDVLSRLTLHPSPRSP